jgi:hypothetical protein
MLPIHIIRDFKNHNQVLKNVPLENMFFNVNNRRKMYKIAPTE